MSPLHRFADADELARGAADRLLKALIALQKDGGIAQLCLTGGRIANLVYTRLGALVEDSALDPKRLELWWGDERFIPTEDPDRNAGPTLAVMAGQFPLDPARTHPMPAADGVADNAASAATYGKELDDTVFDICLLGLGEDGHVASVFPEHASFDNTSHTVIAVNDAPKAPAQRISLSIPAINRSRQVWFLVSGEEKAPALARAIAGDRSIPAGVARGTENTLWLVDAAAASGMEYYHCSF